MLSCTHLSLYLCYIHKKAFHVNVPEIVTLLSYSLLGCKCNVQCKYPFAGLASLKIVSFNFNVK